MRRALILLLFLVLFLPAGFAAPCYGIKLPHKNNFSTGYQVHAILDRDLEGGFGSLRSTQHFFLISYGVFDWLSIDLKGGAGNIKQHPLNSDEIDYTSSFAGGYGFRIKMYDKGDTAVVFGFQHISVHPKTIHLGGVNHQAILDDWQVSLLAGHNFNRFCPYAGMRFSRVDYIHWIEEDRKRRMSLPDESTGMVLGCDFSISDKIWINAEGNLFNGRALSFSVNYEF
ncbi:MAG: hypothetical protein ABH872_06565 [Candidatus Omnitrophota bacterium]